MSGLLWPKKCCFCKHVVRRQLSASLWMCGVQGCRGWASLGVAGPAGPWSTLIEPARSLLALFLSNAPFSVGTLGVSRA